MADIFDPAKRSEIMSRIRGKNTKPEVLVFSYLRTQGIYFQKHYRSKEGVILDLALPRKKKAVMIDGDFWHGRSVERIAERRGEEDFWTKKLRRNIERDRSQRELLNMGGWQLLEVWGSDLTKKSTQKDKLTHIREFLLTP